LSGAAIVIAGPDREKT